MSYDGRVYRVQVGNVERKLPLFEVAPGVKIAIFNMLGDTEVVETSAALLAGRMPLGVEVIIVPEVKAVPLGHALSARTGLPYAVVRKVRKPYMIDSIDAEVVSITTGHMLRSWPLPKDATTSPDRAMSTAYWIAAVRSWTIV